MAVTITAPQAVNRNNAGNTLLNTGKLQVFNGATLLVEFTLANPAFGASTSACPSIATAAGLPITATAAAFGATPLVANNAKVITSAGVEHFTIAAASIGATGSGLPVQLSNTTVTQSQSINLTAFTITQPCS